ncbi:MAG: prepilin-type N-terminal cleavage/methylation domain-containing protein [Candidatus Taylorbacteria bacterium]
MLSNKEKNGFSLIEVLIGTAIFLVVATAAYSLFTSLLKLAAASQANIMAVQLADEQFEIIRNMPYTSVGLTNGIPLGTLPQTQTLTRGNFTFVVGLTIRNINLSTSTVQASDKLIEISITCPSCRNFSPVELTGQISPSNLQSASNGGALVVNAFDANGLPIQGATVYIQSMSTSSVTNTDVTNNYGVLNVIGVPQGAGAYQVIVSKSGYSTDRTYAIGTDGNPNPTRPNLTVLNGQVSSASFAIDRLSRANFSSVTPLCAPVAGFDFNLIGAKQIGASLPKYSRSVSTDGAGKLTLPSMEWDTYTVSPTDTSYDLAGMNPFSPFTLNPDNSQDVQFIVVPKNSNSVMVSVMDNRTRLPISGATVRIYGNSIDRTDITGQGYISQTDWSGGSGQVEYSTTNKYFADNGQVDTATSSGNILLKMDAGQYITNTWQSLESSTFNTGTTSNFYTLTWAPINQPVPTGAGSVKFQFATNPTSTSTIWDFLGPDGTAGSYYTVPGGAINTIHNGNQFARYKVFMSTATATSTPSVSDASFAFTSSCIPPGQVLFQGLSTGNYTISVSKDGYTAVSASTTVSSGWQERVIRLEI